MKYEYRTITISNKFDDIKINTLFDKGWEYVDSVAQVVSTGATIGDEGFILVFLRREKLENVSL